MDKGEIVTKSIEIVKIKRGVPTVVRIDDQDYVLRPRDRYRGKKPKKTRRRDG